MLNVKIRARIANLQLFFEERDTRERILIVLLSWALLYAIFNYAFFSAIDTQRATVLATIQQKKTDINNANIELANIEAIKKTPLYQQWLKNETLKNQMKSEIGNRGPLSTEKQWQRVFNVLLQPEVKITLLNVKKLPDVQYQPLAKTTEETNIFSQPVMVVVQGQFFDFVNYLTLLEKELPFIRWNKLHYQVTEYPTAKIDMEFSILYEKN